MTRLFCLAMMLFGLGACGDRVLAPTVPAPVVISCGEIVLNTASASASDPDAARQAITCFDRAYRECAASSLMVRQADSGITRQFSVIPEGSGCALRQALQTDPNSPPAVADCKTAKWDQNTLFIESCSHLGDFTLTP